MVTYRAAPYSAVKGTSWAAYKDTLDRWDRHNTLFSFMDIGFRISRVRSPLERLSDLDSRGGAK